MRWAAAFVCAKSIDQPITHSTIRIELRPNECTKDALLRNVLEPHLRMPLHANAPGMLDVFDRLDEAVFRPRHWPQAVADAIDALMMPRAYLGVRGAEDARQAAVGLDAHAVHADVARRHAVRHAVAVMIGQVD